MAGVEGIKDTGIITDPGINPNTTQNDVASTQHASHQATDTTISNTPASIKSEHVKDTTEGAVDITKPGTIANYNDQETEKEVAIETDPDVQKALARAVISNSGSVKLGDAP